jgi:hypothetical protein
MSDSIDTIPSCNPMNNKISLQTDEPIEKLITEQNIRINCDDVRIECEETRIKNKEIRIDCEEIRIKIEELQKDIKELQKRYKPIIIRETMAELEEHIMFEIIGSKKKMRKFFDIHDLFNSELYKTECELYLHKHDITEDVIYLIVDLKENGEISEYEDRMAVERSDWNTLIYQSLDDPNDIDGIKLISDILKLMEKYFLVPIIR